MQLVIDLSTLEIVQLVCRKGRVHDFRVLKESGLCLQPSVLKLADSGYQGLKKWSANSQTPVKRRGGKPLSADALRYNRNLSRRRIRIEHVNRRCKIFRLAQQRYRGKHRHYGKSWHVVAGLVNLRYQQSL